jgi:hypothetical protein
MRPRSLELTLDGLPDEATVDGPAAFRVVIFNSLKDAGIDKDSIEGIECFSKTLWYVVFHERATRQKYRELTIKIFEKDYKLKSNEFNFTDRITYTYVRVYGYPLDSDTETLKQTMEMYGEMVSLTDDMDGRLGIKTGVRTVKYKKLNEAIPSFIYAGRYQVRTAYKNQPRTCRNCQKEGHNAKECTAGKVCRICGEPGHTKGSCPQRRCYYCHEKGHETSSCNKYVEDYPSLLTKESDTPPTESGNPPVNEHDKNTEANGSDTTPVLEVVDEGQQTSLPLQDSTAAEVNTMDITPENNQEESTVHQPKAPPIDTNDKPPDTTLATNNDDMEVTTESKPQSTPPTSSTGNEEPSIGTQPTTTTHQFKQPTIPPRTQPPPPKPTDQPMNTTSPQDSDRTLTPRTSGESSSEDEPPLKTIKTVSTPSSETSNADNTDKEEETGKKTTATATKEGKSPRKKNKTNKKKKSATVVSQGRSRHPF